MNTVGRRSPIRLTSKRQKRLQSYLQSSQLSDDEIRAIVMHLVEQDGKEFRKVMPQAAKETKGRADGARVQKIVRELTQ